MRYLISGYYGFGNEGDELVLSALLRALDDVRGEVTVLSAAPEATRARHGVRAADRWRPQIVLRELLRCRTLISGGGGLVQDLSGPMTPGYYLGLVAGAKVLGKRALLIGQGFGPVRRTWNPHLCCWILPHADWIAPRDAQGADWCRAFGVPERKLFLSADPVWTLPAPAARPGRDWAVCLRADWLGCELPLWLNRVVQCAREHRRRLRFVSLGNRGDRELLRRIEANLGGACAYAAAPETPADELFAGTELAVSMRYHGLILGARAGAAVAGFGADEKIRILLGELGQPVLEPDRIENGLSALAARLKTARAAAARRMPELRTRAERGLASLRGRLGLTPAPDTLAARK